MRPQSKLLEKLNGEKVRILTTILFIISTVILANGQQTVVPIIEVKVGGLLGGVQNGKWLDAKTTFEMLNGEKSYSLFGIKGRVGELTATVESPDVPCEEFYYVKNDLDVREGIGVGTNRNWNIVPRTPRAISLTDKTYLKIVSDILRANGLPKSKPRIEQAVRVDLEGDGVDEVLLTAGSYTGNIQPNAAAGNYSFVLLRKIVGGKVKNIIIAEEYVKKRIEFGAPSRFEISAIADLNGDGKMEFVLYGEYYEGSEAGVYEMKGDQAVEVKELSAGCGV